MKCVVLDGYLVNFDRQAWATAACHELVWHDYTAPEEIAAAIGDAQAVFTNRAPITAQTVAACPALRYIGTFGTGFNMIDLEATTAAGITVCNVPGYSTQGVAQGTFGLLLDIVSRISVYNDFVKAGKWTESVDSRLTAITTTELAGKTMGIIGLGSIGQAVARMAMAFGMKVIACRRSSGRGMDGVEMVSFEELLARSHVVSLHCPLSAQTAEIINASTLSQMREEAILLNTARGGLLNEADVAAALDSGKLAWAGLDGLSQEPPQNSPLTLHSRTVITPHVAWMARETRGRLLEIAAANLEAFVAGTPQNVVTLQK